MNILEELEDKAGHKLTMVTGMMGGVTTYYCENCGALVQIQNREPELRLFHVGKMSLSTTKECNPREDLATHPRQTLREKMIKLHDEDWARLKRS